MRMRYAERDRGARELVAFLKLLAHLKRNIARHSDQVQRHQHGTVLGPVLDHERLRPKLVVLRVGRTISPAITRQPDRQLRRNVYLGHTGLPLLLSRRTNILESETNSE